MGPGEEKDPRKEKKDGDENPDKSGLRDDEPGGDELDSDFGEQEEGLSDKDFDEFSEGDDDFEGMSAGDKRLPYRRRYHLLPSAKCDSDVSRPKHNVYRIKLTRPLRFSQFASGRPGVSVLIKHLKLNHNLSTSLTGSPGQNDSA